MKFFATGGSEVPWGSISAGPAGSWKCDKELENEAVHRLGLGLIGLI